MGDQSSVRVAVGQYCAGQQTVLFFFFLLILLVLPLAPYLVRLVKWERGQSRDVRCLCSTNDGSWDTRCPDHAYRNDKLPANPKLVWDLLLQLDANRDLLGPQGVRRAGWCHGTEPGGGVEEFWAMRSEVGVEVS